MAYRLDAPPWTAQPRSSIVGVGRGGSSPPPSPPAAVAVAVGRRRRVLCTTTTPAASLMLLFEKKRMPDGPAAGAALGAQMRTSWSMVAPNNEVEVGACMWPVRGCLERAIGGARAGGATSSAGAYDERTTQDFPPKIHPSRHNIIFLPARILYLSSRHNTLSILSVPPNICESI